MSLLENKNSLKFVKVQLVHVPLHTNFRWGRNWWYRMDEKYIASKDNHIMISLPIKTFVGVTTDNFPF